MSRATRTDFPGAFRLVITRTLGDTEYTEYVGPYQTIGAAKGQLTDHLRMRHYEHYSKKVGHIESTTGGWEKVEAA